jgi:DNA modification methylase
MKNEIYNMDCLDKLKGLEENSLDSIVTDPPYGLSFMGKKWDYDVPSQEIWEECLRVLKPGGYLLSFAGSRTYHRMAVRIEDAGFEIKNMIAWVYGSGFPKSHNIEKSLRKSGHEDEANKYKGWGSQLKPAIEPIVMAQKPLSEKTIASNVLKWGCGGINIDGSRVLISEKDFEINNKKSSKNFIGTKPFGNSDKKGSALTPNSLGRFPANIIHDGSDEVLAGFPDTKSGSLTSGQQINGGFKGAKNCYGTAEKGGDNNYSSNQGSAARFFYCAKASKSDRGVGNTHVTVKPTKLMQYLVKLVTPTNGTCLDPFMGSGSTGKAAKLEGFNFVGIEREEEYFNIAKARIDSVEEDKQQTLF